MAQSSNTKSQGKGTAGARSTGSSGKSNARTGTGGGSSSSTGRAGSGSTGRAGASSTGRAGSGSTGRAGSSSTGRAGAGNTGRASAARNSNENSRKAQPEESVVREKYVPTEADKKLHGEIKLLAALTLSVLLLLSNFGIISPVGDYISFFMFGVVGLLAYVFPILLFVGVAFFISNKTNHKAMVKLGAAIGFCVFLCTFIQLILFDNKISYGGFYAHCGNERNGGGIIGGIIAKALCSVMGRVGAFIVVIILLIICLVLITERSIVNLIKNGSKKVYDTAKEDIDRRKESAVEKAEEKEYYQRRRIHKKVRGVAITRVGDEGADNEDVHEITGEIHSENVYRGHVDIEEISRNPVSELEPEMYEEEEYSQEEELEADKYYGHEELQRSFNNSYVSNDNAGWQSQERSVNDNTGWQNQESSNVRTGLQAQTGPGAGQVQKDWTADEPARKYSLIDNGDEYVTATVGTAKGYDDGKSDDDEQDFRPKEQLQVAQSAVNTMKRKAFDVGAPSGMPDATRIQTADVGNESYGSKTSEINRSSQSNSLGGAVGNQGAYGQLPKKKEYRLPDISLLNKGQATRSNGSDLELRETANNLKQILENFGVRVSVNNYSKGPSVTRYELQPEVGTRLSKITSLADDIKLNLAATDIKIEAPIPGKSAVGIEVPNAVRESVLIRELIESEELKKNPSKLAFAAGKDIAGKVVVADIAKMPHMLVAGTTGSGKSVFTNSIIMTILYRAKPSEVRLIIIDPKVVEFGIYNGIPHLLQPVVTDAKLASNTLKWAVNEMSERYKKFAELNVRDLAGYNNKLASSPDYEEGQKLPQILIVIDELADLMMVAAKEVEESICRLAQLARAAGIHLIIATQRPSVDVVTGLIKANIPSRTALKVSSGTDSRTIIDTVGAEKMLGNGDMLFYPAGYLKPVRLQGAFVSDQEVQRVVEFWTSQASGSGYDNSISEYISFMPQSSGVGASGEEDDSRDEYFADAGRFITDKQKASISSLQRVFKIGFNRAARIIEQLEEAGVVGADEGTKPRNVLMTKEEFEDFLNS